VKVLTGTHPEAVVVEDQEGIVLLLIVPVCIAEGHTGPAGVNAVHPELNGDGVTGKVIEVGQDQHLHKG
jgi:hypothetical protein